MVSKIERGETRRCWSGLIGLALAAVAAPALAQGTPAPHGIVPQGIWVLNPGRSHSLNPGRQTLWVVKDDGRHLVWVSVIIDDQHRVQIVSYDGAYGGSPAPVVGSPMTTQIVATGPASLHNFGTIVGVGDYSEDCRVSQDRTRFRCEGQVQTTSGARPYMDDFDWFANSPPAAQP